MAWRELPSGAEVPEWGEVEAVYADGGLRVQVPGRTDRHGAPTPWDPIYPTSEAGARGFAPGDQVLVMFSRSAYRRGMPFVIGSPGGRSGGGHLVVGEPLWTQWGRSAARDWRCADVAPEVPRLVYDSAWDVVLTAVQPEGMVLYTIGAAVYLVLAWDDGTDTVVRAYNPENGSQRWSITLTNVTIGPNTALYDANEPVATPLSALAYNGAGELVLQGRNGSLPQVDWIWVLSAADGSTLRPANYLGGTASTLYPMCVDGNLLVDAYKQSEEGLQVAYRGLNQAYQLYTDYGGGVYGTASFHDFRETPATAQAIDTATACPWPISPGHRLALATSRMLQYESGVDILWTRAALTAIDLVDRSIAWEWEIEDEWEGLHLGSPATCRFQKLVVDDTNRRIYGIEHNYGGSGYAIAQNFHHRQYLFARDLLTGGHHWRMPIQWASSYQHRLALLGTGDIVVARVPQNVPPTDGRLTARSGSGSLLWEWSDTSVSWSTESGWQPVTGTTAAGTDWVFYLGRIFTGGLVYSGPIASPYPARDYLQAFVGSTLYAVRLEGATYHIRRWV